MKKILFGLLLVLSCITGFSQSVLNNTYTKRQSDAKYTSKTDLSNTVAGAEGIRLVGAVGGYTLESYLEDTATRGPSRDLPQFIAGSNLDVSYSGGDVYDPLLGYFHLDPGSKTNLVDNAVNIAYWNTNDVNLVQWTTGTRPDPISSIYLGTFVTSQGKIVHSMLAIAVGDELLYEDAAFEAVFPSVISKGMQVFLKPNDGTDLTNLQFEAGTIYHNIGQKIDYAGLDFNTNSHMVIYSHSSSITNWVQITTNLFPVGKWDNGTNLVACNAAKWYRGVFVALDDNQLTWIAPDAEYTNSLEAIEGNDPDMPPGFTPYIPKCTAYVFKGNDTKLNDSTYFVDQRNSENLLKGNTTSGSGIGNIPSLSQVLAAGPSAGGIKINNLGLPISSDDAANKDYVDSKINNVNSFKVYVDGKGNDSLAKVESSILPFKTIQASINAAALASGGSNRYTAMISPGVYIEDISMSNNVSISGNNIEDTIVKGEVVFPPAFTDIVGSEVALLTVSSTNKPALVINSGSDDAYAGVRSCYLTTTYTEDSIIHKTVISVKRGLSEVYGTTYNELFINTIDGIVAHVSIFEHTTDLNNAGLSEFTSFNSSSIINCTDINDDVSMAHTYDNTDAETINVIMGGLFNIHLDHNTSNHGNMIKLVSHENAMGKTLSMGNVTRLYMDETNSCNLFMAYAKDGAAENVAIIRNNHIRVISGSSSNIWFGAATTTNDGIRIYDTELIQKNAFHYYPRRYTNEGMHGSFYINTPQQNGDFILGGALDLFTPNSLNDITYNVPTAGHIKLYLDNTTGLEQPYYIDSTATKFRICRDTVFLGYNTELDTLRPGEVVTINPGSTNHLQNIKRATANISDQSQVLGIINTQGGVLSLATAHIMAIGTTEATPVDTSAYVAGTPLFLSATIPGGFTNTPPPPPYVTKQIGWVGFSDATNGTIIVDRIPADVFGNQIPIYYATSSNLVAETNRAYVAETNLQAQIVTATSRVAVLEGRSNVWNTASTDAINATNRVKILEGRSNVWNTASTDAISATSRVFVIEGKTSLWNTASTDAINATNRVFVIEGKTSLWNTASTDAINATNRVTVLEGRSNVWNIASTDAINATNRVKAMESRTSIWDKASVDGIDATNRVKILEASTSNWNSAYTWSTNDANQDTNVSVAVLGLYTVTNAWGFNEPVPITTKPNDIYISGEFHKVRNWVEFHAMTESGTVQGQIFIRHTRDPIRTYTVVTNFNATTTSTNLTVMTGTIPALYTIGIVITNVTASTSNLWISLDYATTNGLKDL